MEQIKRQVGKARHRLTLQRFVGALGWFCFATLLIALGLILADKVRPLGVEAWAWGAGALVVGLVGAAVWAVVRGQGPVDAAIEVDRRFGLQERLSSALSLSEQERETPSGQALLDDAEKRAQRLEVGEHFGITPGRQILLPLIPAIVAVLVALFVSPITPGSRAQASTDPAIKKQIEKSSETLRKKLLEKRKEAKEKGLKDAEELFRKLEEGTDDLSRDNPGKRKKAMVKLNDLAREIQKRREALGGADRLKEQMNRLKKIDQGPADKFSKAIKKGDFKQAIKELEKLKTDLKNLDAKERKQLANQLDQMKEKLQKMAEAHQEAQKDLEKRMNQARQAGQNEEAERLQEQLNQLRQQSPQMDQLQNMANQLGQCAECMKNGQMQEAGDMLDSLQNDVGNLQEQLQELDMLNEALDQMAQCRDQMNCGACGGIGCGECQGPPGRGMGRGRGKGDRPEEKNAVNFIETKPKMKIGPGSASIVGEVEGPNFKGDFQVEMKEQLEQARRQSTDPLTGQQIPRSHRDHVGEYLDRLREGE